jgi:maltose alpha-D-glucosyltransferase / alpha-amylase
MRLGIRIITDFIPNHLSTRHPWFEALLSGDETKLDWFLPMDDAELIGTEVDEKGKLRVLLRNGQGLVSKPWAIFPHASKKNLIEVTVNGKKHQLFHSFYPFQVDLNLRNPEVLSQLFKVLGWEANHGVAGKRMDAAPHWFKEEGTNYENLRGTHALQELFKRFVRHIIPGKGITIPEVGEGLEDACCYFGQPAEILGKPSRSEGDAMFGFEWNSTLWVILLEEDPSFFWSFAERMERFGKDTYWFNLGRHHDELRTDLMPPQVRDRIEAKLLERGAEVFAGRGVGGRMANFLESNPQHIALALWLNYLPPQGTPVNYYGDELGAENQREFMSEEQRRRLPILAELGFPVHDAQVALDRRDVGRGGITQQTIDAAVEAEYPPLLTVRAMNALWADRLSLRAGAVRPLAVSSKRVLAVTKQAEGEAPLFAIGNLGGEPVNVQVSAADLRSALGADPDMALTLVDILGAMRDGSATSMRLAPGTHTVDLTLPAFGHGIFVRQE